MAFDAIYQDLKQWKERRYEASNAAINLKDRRILHKFCPNIARRIRLHKVDGKMALRINRLCSHFSTPGIMPGSILRQPSRSTAGTLVRAVLVGGLIIRRVYKHIRNISISSKSIGSKARSSIESISSRRKERLGPEAGVHRYGVARDPRVRLESRRRTNLRRRRKNKMLSTMKREIRAACLRRQCMLLIEEPSMAAFYPCVDRNVLKLSSFFPFWFW